MRLPRTLSAYTLGEVLLYSSLGLLAVTTLLVGRNLLRHLDELIRAGSPAAEIGIVVVFLASSLATYAVPVAFLFGVLLAVGRLAGDSEIIALQSCGVGLPSLVLPIAALGLAIAGLTAFLTFDVEHRAQRRLRLTIQTLAAEGRLIEAGQFRRVGERILFVKERGDADQLHGVLIADRSKADRPLLIFAERGETKWDPDLTTLHLELSDGSIHLDDDVDALPGTSTDARAALPTSDPPHLLSNLRLRPRRRRNARSKPGRAPSARNVERTAAHCDRTRRSRRPTRRSATARRGLLPASPPATARSAVRADPVRADRRPARRRPGPAWTRLGNPAVCAHGLRLLRPAHDRPVTGP